MERSYHYFRAFCSACPVFNQLKVTVIFLVFFAFLKLQAQTPVLNNVISPPPDAASLARFAEVPVNFNTGIPQVTVPLYTIRSLKLSYPLSLSYHASGIKVDDIASPVGLGWTINSGGIITRVVRGRPDEQDNCFFEFAASIPDQAGPIDAITKKSLADGDYDMIPDLFYYNIGVGAGKIIFDNELVPRTLPKSDIKITTNSTSTLSQFTITTSEGTNYEFDAGELSTAQIPGNDPTFTSTWYLSRIVSVDKLDTIRFNYTPASPYSYTTNKNTSLKYFYNAPEGASRALYEVQVLSSGAETTVTGTRYLTSIEYNTGKVQFIFSGGRNDYSAGKKIDDIIIYHKDPITGDYGEEKRVHFSYTYFQNTDSTTMRLRLDNIQEHYPLGITSPPYTFQYLAKSLPHPESPAQDHWGYYNGALSNTNLIPAFTYDREVISTNNREVGTNYSDGCMLEKIISPLGGITEFDFEPNQYFDGVNNNYGPGLRIESIRHKDPYSNINTVTHYEYKNPLTGVSSGVLINRPYYYEDIPVKDLAHGELLTYNCLLIMANGTSIGDFSGAPLIYEYVTVFQGEDENVSGKTTSKFSLYSEPPVEFPFFPAEDNSWLSGNVLFRETYKVQEGIATPVSRIDNTYSLSPYYHTIKGLSVAFNKIRFNNPPVDESDYTISNYYTYSKFQFLSQRTSFDFEQNNAAVSASKTENYYYDHSDVHVMPTRIETSISETNSILRKEFTYAPDYPATGVLGAMQELNMVAYPIETISTRIDNGTEYVTDYKKTDYFEWQPMRIYPKFIYGSRIPLQTLRGTFDLDPAAYSVLKLNINQYNSKGMVQESQVEGGLPAATIMDHYTNRVVSKTSPAKATQIAYTSFESRDYGQWSVDAGSQIRSATMSLGLGSTFDSFSIDADQTITYNYSVTRTFGPSPLLVFSKEGTTSIQRALTGVSGSGSVMLTEGQWSVSLSYDSNVELLDVSFPYEFVYSLSPDFTLDSKTGSHALQFASGNLISRTSLPDGDYNLTYYQKGGTADVAVTGAGQVLTTETGIEEADGWTPVKKTIRINNISDTILISSSSCKIDELRLYPADAFMKTTCYDAHGRVQTVTDINLRSQFYEYDEQGRIKAMRDHNKNILKHYEYKIAGN